MFKNHPKGLIVAFFANMGERFGFYTMMAILVLFLQAKFDVNAQTAGSIYSWFYFVGTGSLLYGIRTSEYLACAYVGVVAIERPSVLALCCYWNYWWSNNGLVGLGWRTITTEIIKF